MFLTYFIFLEKVLSHLNVGEKLASKILPSEVAFQTHLNLKTADSTLVNK